MHSANRGMGRFTHSSQVCEFDSLWALRISPRRLSGSGPSRYPVDMSETDLSVLRRLADDGNEEAADRLAELAAERGDIAELQHLVDYGNEKAADRLAELAAERGDLEELQRLVDEGNEKAAERLSEAIRKIK